MKICMIGYWQEQFIIRVVRVKNEEFNYQKIKLI